MRKIERFYENPIDNVNIDIVDILCPFFKKLNLTPNDITTLSLITGFLSLYCLYKDYILSFCILYYISYIFDCMDGHYARKYNMVSKFGDMYDHIKDISVTITLLVLLYSRYKDQINITVILILVLATICMFSHLGCQENVYSKRESKSLNILKNMCPNPKNIIYSRFVGCGTFIFIVILIVLYLEYTKNNKNN